MCTGLCNGSGRAARTSSAPLDELASIYADNCVCKLAVDDVTDLKAEDACSSQGTPSDVGGAYNGMIKPLLNMTITGAIWYQGEANQDDPRDSVDNNGLPMASYGQCLCFTRVASRGGCPTRGLLHMGVAPWGGGLHAGCSTRGLQIMFFVY